MKKTGKQNQNQPSHQHSGSKPDSLEKVESGARETALPHAHLDVTRAHDCRPVSDVDVFQLPYTSAQVAADSGVVSQGKAISGRAKFAADATAHIGIAGVYGYTALHLALDADVAGGNHDTAANTTPVIHVQRLHQPVDAATQLPVKVK